MTEFYAFSILLEKTKEPPKEQSTRPTVSQIKPDFSPFSCGETEARRKSELQMPVAGMVVRTSILVLAASMVVRPHLNEMNY